MNTYEDTERSVSAVEPQDVESTIYSPISLS